MIRIVLLSVSLWAVFPSWADPQSVEQLKYRLARLNSFQAGFDSTVIDATSGKITSQGQGFLALKQPAMFRFETESPSRTQLIGDGTSLWNYDLDMEQVTIYDAKKEVSQTPFVLLTSADPVLWAQYDVKANGDTYQIIPKAKDAAVQQLQITFDGAGLSQLIILNSDGQQGRFEFVTSQSNVPLDSSLFTFKASADVEVDDQRNK